ncbi:MAG: FMN-binding protein [Elusimicrobiota bacterium]|nr:FMN-binding protein [Elusimicrobiota bacterium]
MRKILNYTFRLTFICVVSAFVLSWVYSKIKPKIELYEKQRIYLAQRELLPEATEFKVQAQYTSGYNDKSELVGKIVSSEKRGYSSKIKILIGLDIQNKITGIKIIDQNETPGLGDQIKKTTFLKQFIGKNKLQIAKIDTVTGATISSKALIEAVREGVEKIVQE